ncbi:hypothetical protein PMIN07_007180, partial [Paraphaeosphaeria minitans]
TTTTTMTSPSPPLQASPSPHLPSKADFLRHSVVPAKKDDRFNDNKCAFCWGAYDETHPAVKIRPCNHVYGRACVEQFVEQEHRCPKCKAELFREEPRLR